MPEEGFGGGSRQTEAEEEGLLGSLHYVDNPVIPLDQTIAYLNLDIQGSNLLPSLRSTTRSTTSREPSGDLPWVIQSHLGVNNKEGLYRGTARCGYQSRVWLCEYPSDLDKGGLHGWRRSDLVAKFNRVMAGIRYAIPTKAIFWIPFGEFLPKYGFYEEIWIRPMDYTWEMWGVFLIFIALIVSTAFLPQRRQTQPRKPESLPKQP